MDQSAASAMASFAYEAVPIAQPCFLASFGWVKVSGQVGICPDPIHKINPLPFVGWGLLEPFLVMGEPVKPGEVDLDSAPKLVHFPGVEPGKKRPKVLAGVA